MTDQSVCAITRTCRASHSAKRSLLSAMLVFASACTVLRAPGTEEGISGHEVPNGTLVSGTNVPPARTATARPPSPTATSGPVPEGPALVIALQQPRLSEAFTSPDGRWRADFVVYDCVNVSSEQTLAYQELRLIDTKDGSSRVVDSQLQACGGLGAAGLAGRFWDDGSRFFYYTDAAVGVPDGCGFWMPPYLRLDTFSGGVEYLGGGPISPDGTMLAAWHDGRLGIWQLNGERLGLARILGKVAVPGPIAWRPDSSAVAFLVSEDSCPLGETGLGRIDISNMRAVIIVGSREPSFVDLVWDVPNRVTLIDGQGKRWRYNFASRNLWPVAP